MNKTEIQTRIKRHDRWFSELVWPIIQDAKFPDHAYTSMSASTTATAHAMDYSGIDYVLHPPNGLGVAIGLQSRIQNDCGFNTFTIRLSLPSGQPTEYDKLLNSLSHEHLGPQWFSQAYLADNGLRALFLAPVESLVVAATDRGWDQLNGQDGTEFRCVKYSDVEHCCYWLAETRDDGISYWNAGEIH